MSHRRYRSILLLGSALSASFAPLAHAENERATRTNAVSLELFGRGLLYTMQIDSMLSEELGAGVGFGTVGLKRPGGADLNTSARLIPVYMNYYFQPEQGSLFATLAASLVANVGTAKGNESAVGDVTFSSSSVQPSFGLGYENRSPTGVVLRLTAYGIVAQKVYPWFGFALGYAF
jgi:hypothetical protein